MNEHGIPPNEPLPQGEAPTKRRNAIQLPHPAEIIRKGPKLRHQAQQA